MKSRNRRSQRQLRQLRRRLRQTDQQIQDARSCQQALLEHLPVHIIQKDLEGRFTFVSASFCTLVGRSREAILGKTDFELFPSESARKFVADDQRVIREGTVFDDIEKNVFADGTTTFMQVRKAPLRDRNGLIVGVQVMFWDVTKEHVSRQQLQHIESLAHALITAALDAVLLVDPEGRVVDVNPAAERILGYTRDQVAGHPPLDNILQTAITEAGQRSREPDDSLHMFDRKASISRIMQAATGTRIEAKARHKDLRWFDAEISAHPLSIQGINQGWALFIRDITNRKLRESELRRAKDEAEMASAAKSEFVANVSHELRTPLTGIIGLHELLQLSDMNARQQNYLRLAQTSSTNLLRLIDDLLDFSKIEAGKLQLEMASFSLIECVEDVANAMAARAQLRGLELTVDFGAGLPARLIGDAYRIRQILLNLVGNAIKFTERGDICIRVRQLSQNLDSSHELTGMDSTSRTCSVARLRFEVHDCGIGIAENQRQLIFEAFRQADTSMTRRYGGTGLGLAICHDLVQKMHGMIAVTDSQIHEGTINAGSCFYFEVPLEVDQQPAADPPVFAQQEVVLVGPASLWRTLLERNLQRLGLKITVLTLDQLQNRQPTRLFAAGNHTMVMVDVKELALWAASTPPVVVRWVLITSLAQSQQVSVPTWLSHADVVWLNRPIRQADLLAAITIGNAPDSNQSSEPSLNASRSAHVLLVDDSPVNQIVLRDMLEQLGHQVTLAGDGKQAVELCNERQFDLVLMDVQMPELDGLQATKSIRQRETGRRQLIFALTAHASAMDRQLCEAAGMNGFLVKPITMEVLSGALRTALELDSQSATTKFVSAGEVIKSNVHPIDSNVAPLPIDLAFQDSPDLSMLVARFNNNQRLLKDVLKLMIQEAPKLGRTFASVATAGKLPEARRAIHTLKSNCKQLGLMQIAEYAESIEQIARDGAQEATEFHAGNIQIISSAIADWAEGLLDKLDGVGGK